MKIIELINSLTYRGGAQILLLSLCAEFSNNPDNDVLVVSLYDNIDESIKNDFEKHNIKFLSLHKKNKFDFKCSKLLKKTLNEFQPNIVHMHLSCLPSYYLAFGKRKQKWKLVETMHSIPGSTLSKFAKILRNTFVKNKLLSLVAISDGIYEVAINMYGNDNVFRINNGVRLNNHALQNSIKKYDYIIVASLSEVKNHSLLLDAFYEIVSEQENAKLLVVGDGDLKHQIQEKIYNLSLSNNVELHGSSDDVYPLLNLSKVFVLSSKREGNPLSALEAMSAGLVVVAPRVGGIPDIIENNVNGFLYETSSKEQLVICMKQALQNYEQFVDTNVKKSAQFSISKCADDYLNLFEKLINN